jgi:hypothetical protein
MTSDHDIYRAASELIEQFGEDAPIRAAMRHDDLLRASDADGCSLIDLNFETSAEEVTPSPRI